jgi:hypothetical protein
LAIGTLSDKIKRYYKGGKMEQEKFNWKRLLIIIGIVFFAAIAVGGSTYYVMGVQQKKEIDQFEKIIEEMEKQKDAKLELRDTKNNAASNNTKDTTPVEPQLSSELKWNPYTNSKFGFQFSYPSTHYYEERNHDIYNVIIANNKFKGTQMGIPANAVYVYPKKASDLKVWINSELSGIRAGTLRSFAVNGLSGYYFIEDGMGTYHNYVFEKNGYAYVISNTEAPDTINHSEFINTFKIN